MKKLLATLSVAFLSTAAPQTLIAKEGTQTMNASELRVLAAVENMTAAYRNQNIERVMESYEPQTNVVFERGEPVNDNEQIKAMFEGTFAFNPSFEYSGHEVYISGDLAIHIAPWTMTGKTPDGQAIGDSGLSVAVLRRQSDGEWLIVIDNPYGARLLEAD